MREYSVALKPQSIFVEFLLDQLRDIDDVVSKSMFGGVGLYSGDVFFAIVYHDVVYFKVDDVNRADYIRAGTKPFTPYEGQSTTLQYYEVPASVLEDADELCKWARRAVTAAERKAIARKGKRR